MGLLQKKSCLPCPSLALFIIGASIFRVGFDVIRFNESSIHAPRWVIVAAGMVFALGGIMAMLQGQRSGFGDNPLFRWIKFDRRSFSFGICRTPSLDCLWTWGA